MVRFKDYVLMESLDNPYPWKYTFKKEKDEDGSETLEPVQIITFKTEKDIPYLWYAKQNHYNNVYWEIAFGIRRQEVSPGLFKTDIGKTGTGNSFRVFATVLDITNLFIEQDENGEIQYLTLRSQGDNRTRLYRKYLIPRIEKFEISYEHKDGNETEFHLKRITI